MTIYEIRKLGYGITRIRKSWRLLKNNRCVDYTFKGAFKFQAEEQFSNFIRLSNESIENQQALSKAQESETKCQCSLE